MPKAPEDRSGSPFSFQPKRGADSLNESSPTMVTRSHCQGECPSNRLDGRYTRKLSPRATASAVHVNGSCSVNKSSSIDHNSSELRHFHSHSHNHHHHHNRPLYMADKKRSLLELSDDEEDYRRLKKEEDDSSDEEITLIRRTTNKIMTTIEVSSRKMNSVHPKFTKYASIITILLPFVVFFFSWYYYDYSPSIIYQHPQPQPQQQQHLQAIPPSAPIPVTSSSPFSPNPQSQSNCNVTTICPSFEEITILKKRIDRMEQIIYALSDGNANITKYLNSLNDNLQIISKESTQSKQNYAKIDEKFNQITAKLEEAIEGNKYTNQGQTSPTIEEIETMIRQSIYLYDSDKTGKADYALESSGGSIVASRCSETYDPYGIKYSIWGIPIWYTSNSPRAVIQASVVPGDCWAFTGSVGKVTIKLSARIIPTEFSYEHINKDISRDGNINSAPKDLQIRGLKNEDDNEGVILGNYVYLDNDRPLQVFQVQVNKGRPFQFIELNVLSNHGHPDYTCLYRFRAHGTKT